MAPQSEQRIHFCEVVTEETETVVATAAVACTDSVLNCIRCTIVYKTGEEMKISQNYAGRGI
jgi:hypothetical protein